ncbi:MAG: stage III sporulation AC/AD family protein [Clostridia bacterium]|nr:stage III sporulation AC/AD family protein [Clostridia bacterium]
MNTVTFSAAVAVFAAVCSGLLRKSNREIAALFSVAVVVLLLVRILPDVKSLTETITALADTPELQDTFQMILRCLGIVLLGKTTADLCRDAGESAIASGMETVVKFTVLLLAAPVLQELLHLIQEVLLL